MRQSYAAFPRQTITATSRALYSLLLTTLALLSAACKSPNSPTSTKNAIAQLNVITVPVALDLDGRPGPDGVALKLYASHATNPKAIRIRDGTIEILLFDGTFHGRTNPPPILRTAVFTPAELRLNEFKSNIGYGYDLTLRWGTNLPTQRLMSVGARYTSPDGRPIVSRTSSVTVLNK